MGPINNQAVTLNWIMAVFVAFIVPQEFLCSEYVVHFCPGGNADGFHRNLQ